MGNISSTKTEKTAINKIENLLDSLEYFDYHFNADDTGISWDGYIDLYHGNIDNKGNFDARIDVQIKGRTLFKKRLQDKCKFDIDKRDLENYNKIDGTLFLLVRFLGNGEYKIYYISLLPKNINDLLKEQPNSKNEIRVTLKELKNALQLEEICRNFALDKEIQKKLSKEIFDSNGLLVNDKKIGTFSTWKRGNFNPETILGEEKFVYVLDEKKNIIEVEYAEITTVVQGLNLGVKSKNGEVYYNKINRSTDITGEKEISFGKGFSLSVKSRRFSIKICGTLQERIKQLKFIKDILDNNGFIIGNGVINIKSNQDEKVKYDKLYDVYSQIENFCSRHNINKDINIDLWSNKNFREFLIWIDAIENNVKINVNEWNITTLGSIQIQDIRFSIFADKLEDNSFQIYSIWNSNNKDHYQFRYGEDNTEAIYTNKFFSILNKDVYMADDINIDEMKNFYNQNELEKGEETLLNLQVLEILKAFDITGKLELLDYAKFLLNIIIKYDNLYDTARINYLQIEKRVRDLKEEEIEELISIRDKNKDIMFKISCNLLIGNIEEAKIQFNSLNNLEKEYYRDFPIYKFLENK